MGHYCDRRLIKSMDDHQLASPSGGGWIGCNSRIRRINETCTATIAEIRSSKRRKTTNYVQFSSTFNLSNPFPSPRNHCGDPLEAAHEITVAVQLRRHRVRCPNDYGKGEFSLTLEILGSDLLVPGNYERSHSNVGSYKGDVILLYHSIFMIYNPMDALIRRAEVDELMGWFEAGICVVLPKRSRISHLKFKPPNSN
ncbi:hypothetical protein HAX54_030743 [Datura stramonium]|uniref:Uncharacterized protein n=1 Tax=Datura stramonium TaxID=4076 RepID=A0ABS8V9I4_DATST|nr:hypothetical protein [Datura stramonium]